MHAYCYELCITSCTKIKADDWEEFFSELMSKYGRELLDLADKIMAEAIKLAGEVKETPSKESLIRTLIHYADDRWVGKSPCGDKGDNSEVSNDPTIITCAECKNYLKKDLN